MQGAPQVSIERAQTVNENGVTKCSARSSSSTNTKSSAHAYIAVGMKFIAEFLVRQLCLGYSLLAPSTRSVFLQILSIIAVLAVPAEIQRTFHTFRVKQHYNRHMKSDQGKFVTCRLR